MLLTLIFQMSEKMTMIQQNAGEDRERMVWSIQGRDIEKGDYADVVDLNLSDE